MKRTISLSAALLVVACGGLVINAQQTPSVESAPAQDASGKPAPEKGAGSDAKPDDAAHSEHRAKGKPADPATSQPPPYREMREAGLAGVPAVPAPKYLVGRDVVVSWSEKGEAVWGFSKSIGKWARQEIQPAAKEELVPLVSSSVAALQVGQAIYAFSGQTGRWDILRLPENRKPRVSVNADMVLVTDEENVYTFANSTGRWSSPDAIASEPGDGDELTVFYLKHTKAQSVSAILSQLFRDFSPVVDQRLNAIIVRSDSKEDLAKLEAVLKLLDQPIQAEQPNQTDRARKPTPEDFIRPLRGGARAPARQQPAVPPQQPTPEDLLRAMRGGAGASARQQPATLREKYNELEQQAAQTAEQYRDLPDKATRARFTAAALKRQLADTVKRAFEARQELQRVELGALCQRLVRIERQIATRERIKDTIIKRRIEDLLNPELRWDGTGESALQPAASAKVTQSQSLHAVTQTGDYTLGDSKAIAQIAFLAPQGARVTLPPDRTDTATVELPARVNIFKGSSDGPVLFRLSNIPAHAGLELSGTIELPPISAQTQAFLQHNAIPIQFHNEDVDHASSGNLVTKVIYLPKPEHQDLAIAGVETLVSTRLDPGVNPTVEADRRGHILATLRLGNRVPDDPSAQSGTKPDARAQQLLEVAQSRWEVLTNEYRGGKTELADVLSAANELLEARLGVAQSAQSRRAALQDHISLLKQQKMNAEAKYRSGIATQADVLLLQSALLKAERQLEAETLGVGIQKPAEDPFTALVWIEGLIEEPMAEGGRQPKAVYMAGTTVSPDGLIAVALKRGADRSELLKTATVHLEDRRVVEARLVVYDADLGAGLIKADATNLPYLELDIQPLAADQQLRLHKMTMRSLRHRGGHIADVCVDEPYHRVNDTQGFFTIGRTPLIKRILDETADAALVSVNDNLVGILGLQTPSQDETNAEAAVSGYTAIPAHAIARLMEKYRTESSEARPQLEPVEEEARADGKAVEDPAKLIWDTLGVKLRPLSRDELPNNRYRGGMQVTEIRKGSPAAEAKLRNDDIIVGIHHWETVSADNVAFTLNHPDLQPKQNQPTDIRVYVLRGDETLFATLRLADQSRSPN